MYIHMDSMCLFVLTLRDITHTDTHTRMSAHAHANTHKYSEALHHT